MFPVYKLTPAALLLSLSNTTIGLRDRWWTECDCSPRRWKTHGITNFFPNWKKRQHKSSHNDVMWCYFVLARGAFGLTQCIEKDNRLRLLSRWEPTCHTADMTLFECGVYMWSELQRAPRVTKWLGVSKQPTNRPVLSQTGSWEQQRRCLVSSASSALCLVTAAMSDGVHNSVLDGCFDFSLCDTSVACHVALCLSAGLSATGANAALILLSVFTNRARAYKPAGMVLIMRKVRRPYETLRAPVQPVSQAISPDASVWRVGCGVWVLRIKRCIIC